MHHGGVLRARIHPLRASKVPTLACGLLLAGLALTLLPGEGRAQRILEVSAHGAGAFRTVQDAIDSVSAVATDWTVIHVRAGHYFERLEIPSTVQKVILVGDGRDETVLEYDASFIDSQGRLVAWPVLTNYARDVVVRSLSIVNLADEPGGSHGLWDAALRNYGDRLILNDVFLRADHDTLLLYGPAFGGGPAPSRVYVHDSHIQGRGDFIASFSEVFIENSVLETIRDPSHFLFQKGVAGRPSATQDAMVVKSSTFTGRSTDPTWPAGVTNLDSNAVVYLVGNVFEYDIGANRPVVHFHSYAQAFSSQIRHHGNTQRLSGAAPLIWHSFSAPGPIGNPRPRYPNTTNNEGQPIVAPLSAAQAAPITPLWLFGNWNPRQTEPRSDCENGGDDDGDGAVDLDDLGCTSRADFSELADLTGVGSECGIGVELLGVLPLLMALRQRNG